MARLWRTLRHWDVADAQPVRGGCQEVAQQQSDKKPQGPLVGGAWGSFVLES